MPDTAPRKRGGQPGNRNRLRHGRYAATTIGRRKEVMALGRLARHALTRVKMILRTRKALKRVRTAPRFSAVIPGEDRMRSMRCEGRGSRSSSEGGVETEARIFLPDRDVSMPGFPSLRSLAVRAILAGNDS